MHVSISHKRYRLTFEKLPHRRKAEGSDHVTPNKGEFYGDCSPPTQPNRRIRISNRLRGVHQLEIIIHEVMHAADWSKDEEFVQQFGEDLSRILWRLGYRRVEDAGGETNGKDGSGKVE